MYQYKSVALPQKFKGGEDAASHLQDLLNSEAKEGWEFVSVDPVGVTVPPGCIASILGQGESRIVYYVVTLKQQS